LVNHRTGEVLETVLDARPGPMFIVIRFGARTTFAAGYGILAFM
jgi:hypothetical protein